MSDIEALGKLSKKSEEIHEDPILGPLNDYNDSADMYSRQDEYDGKRLEEANKVLNKILEMGIFDNSLLRMKFEGVLEVYKKLLFTFKGYSTMADTQIGELRKTVDKYYITKNKHQIIVNELKSKIRKGAEVVDGLDDPPEEVGEVEEKPKKRGRPKRYG